MNIGHNIGLTPAEVMQAIREFALTRATSRGSVIATIDPLDFQNRAAVHYSVGTAQGPDGTSPIPVVSASVTWEG